MKKNVIIIILLVVASLIVFKVWSALSEGTSKKPGQPAASAKGAGKTTPVLSKKVFAKDAGGLTVNVKNSKSQPQYLRVKAFKADGNNTSIYAVAFSTERMQELPNGTYDLEMETIPPKLYKNIVVKSGKETIEDLGAVTGSLNIKALNSKKKESPILARVTQSKAKLMVASITANRPVEIIPGIYNIDLETVPRQTKKDIKVEAGKETLVDLGVVAGSLNVKAASEDGKEARYSVRVQNAATNYAIASAITNRALELAPGEYNIEVMTMPIQVRKGVKINAGEDTTVEIIAPNPTLAVKRK